MAKGDSSHQGVVVAQHSTTNWIFHDVNHATCSPYFPTQILYFLSIKGDKIKSN